MPMLLKRKRYFSRLFEKTNMGFLPFWRGSTLYSQVLYMIRKTQRAGWDPPFRFSPLPKREKRAFPPKEGESACRRTERRGMRMTGQREKKRLVCQKGASPFDHGTRAACPFNLACALPLSTRVRRVLLSPARSSFHRATPFLEHSLPGGLN